MTAITRIRQIFCEALEKETPDERETFLKHACKDDSSLRAQLDRLLEAHLQGDCVLEGPILTPAVSLDGSLPVEAPGTNIGRYKLLEKIGEGGMAVVYMAQQEKPLRRKVALKIIKLGMDTSQVIARFEAERQALAMMDHPNIARVLDAGATETGRPYFVMELVTGVSITEYCDQNKLSPKERLALFIQVCNAVQHAHQKGIIHRDIKPTNVMVTMHDGEPMPKVIDFGIAKATNQKLTEKTLFTRYAHIIGTPAYMSPEQAELSDVDIDTRSDIYSLGVLLYELLTGTTPFGEGQLRSAGYLEMQRIIREEEPTKPSTKLKALGATLIEIAQHRQVTPDMLRRLISGDLDWIVMKSLDKDRTRRYDTASALAFDVQRHLENEPVLARRPSTVYRLQKFLHRNRIQVIAALVLVIVIGAVGIMLLKWNQIRIELAQSEPDIHRNMMSQARGFHAQGQYLAALDRVRDLLPSKHVGSEAQLLYAVILVEGRQHSEAMTLLKELVNDQPEVAGAAHALWARMLWESQPTGNENQEDIEEHKKQAKALLSQTAEAHFLHAMTALTIKDKFESLRKALDLDRTHYESYRLRVFTNYASQNFESMERDAFAMTLLQPRNPLGFSLCAIALGELGRYDESLAHANLAISLMERDDPKCIDLKAQRCDVLMRQGEYEQAMADAQDGLTDFPNEAKLYFHLFCALTALGDYEEATTHYQHVKRSLPTQIRWFHNWTMKYVFDALEANQPWHPMEKEPEGIAFLTMLEAEQTYDQLKNKAKRIISRGFLTDWSPDGTKLAFSLGVHGYNGLAVFDVTTEQTELLIVPGKDPRWSPDGKYIAFVRDRPKLHLSALATAERRTTNYVYKEEVWVIRADGTEARRLAVGNWPSWSQDAQHIYYRSHLDNTLYSLSIADGSRPEPLFKCQTPFPSISPDNEKVAYAKDDGSLQTVDVLSQATVTHQVGPRVIWGGNWAPSGREISIGGYHHAEERTGLWIYDLQTEQAAKVLSGQITYASWTPDHTTLAFTLGPPFYEIWLANLNPNLSTIEALGPGRTMADHCQDMVDHYTRIVKVDPKHAESFLHRAQYYDYLRDKDSVLADMNQYVALLNPSHRANSQDPGIQKLVAALSQGSVENLGPIVNSPYVDRMPVITGDGLSLFFSSTRPGGHGDYDLWEASRATTDAPWGKPLNLGSTINSSDIERFPGLSMDGLSLFFASNRTGGFGDLDIWMAVRPTTDSLWSSPVNMGGTINSSASEGSMCLSHDGQSFYFTSDRPGGVGTADIYVSTRVSTGEPWGEPANLGSPINTSTLDGHPTLSRDGLLLFFNSFRTGGFRRGDIWVTGRVSKNDDWSTPVNLGPSLNTCMNEYRPSLSTDGSTIYFSSDRSGGAGGSDIWQVNMPPLSGFVQSNDDAESVGESVLPMNGKEE
jgi:serine/threonine protein kinase/Tol biopolymer transport system component/tetratricopeptide (TPR) repeat protein